MKRTFIAFGLSSIVLAGCGTTADNEPTAADTGAPAPTAEQTTEPAVEPTTEPAQTTESPAPAEDDGLSDDGWRVDSLKVEEDYIGDFAADARIVNESGVDVEGAIFDLTVLDGGNIVATLMGSADSVAAGDTVTVTFFSTDDFVKGEFTYDFQVGLSY